ncbi:MAG: hypothetical protein VX726_11070 [Planctomycetota bacterium]|nr:hypothetical protein [Planctomycetota bacterium]
MSTTIRRPGFLVTLLVALAAFLAWEAPASAQGTAGTVPEPIGLRDLVDRLSRYTALDAEDRVSLERAHDTYLGSFERLRGDEIESFLSLMDELSGGTSGRMPDLASVDRMLESWEDVRDRVGVLDDVLFDSIVAGLGDGKRDAVGRLRRVRDRERQLGSAGMTGGETSFGIDDAFWDLDPTLEERLAVEDVLRAYESAMPRLAEDFADASVGMIRRMTAGMIEAGLGDLTAESMADPAEMERVMDAVDAVMQTAYVPTRAAREKIQDREIVAWKGIRSRIPPARAHQLKRRWAVEVFPWSRLESVGPVRVPSVADLVREVIGDAVDANRAVDGILEEWYRADDRLTDRMIEAGRRVSPYSFVIEEANEIGPTPFELSEDRAKLARATADRLLGLVPDPERRTELRRRIDDPSGASSLISKSVTEFEDLVLGDFTFDPGPDTAENTALGGAITRDDLLIFSAIVGLDESSWPVIEALHEDYLDRWKRTTSPVLEDASAIETWNDPEGVRTRGALIEEALRAAIPLDGEFIDSMEIALGTEASASRFEAVRVQRSFDRNAVLSDGRSEGGLVIQPPTLPSPYRELCELELEPERLRRAMDLLVAQTPLLQVALEGIESKQLASSLRAEEAMAAIQKDLMAGTEADAAATMAAIQGHIASLAEVVRERFELDRVIRRVVDPIVEDVAAELDELAALEFRIAMRDQGVRRGGEAVGLPLARQVLRLRDLAEDQVGVIQTLLLDHFEREVAEVDALVERLGDRDLAALDGGTGATRELDRAAFRRAELEERLIQRLLAILTPEQAGRIPRLAERLRD